MTAVPSVGQGHPARVRCVDRARNEQNLYFIGIISGARAATATTTFSYVVSSSRILEYRMPDETPRAACLNSMVRFQRTNATLQKIRFFDFRSAEFLELMEPATEHRFYTLVDLNTPAPPSPMHFMLLRVCFFFFSLSFY